MSKILLTQHRISLLNEVLESAQCVRPSDLDLSLLDVCFSGGGGAITAHALTTAIEEADAFLDEIEDDPEEKEQEYYTLTDIITAKDEPLQMLWKYFLRVGLMAVVGNSDGGKSMFLRQLCLAVISEQGEFLEEKINAKRGKALYISSEDNIDITKSVFEKMLIKFPNAQADNLYFCFTDSNLIEKIEKRIATQKVDLVVIDAYLDFFTGDSQNGESTRKFLKPLQNLAQKYECLIVIIHHTGKAKAEATPSKHNVIGSQSFEGKLRAIFELRTDTNNPLKKHFCPVKGNYLSSVEKSESLILDFDEESLTFSYSGNKQAFAKISPQIEEKKQKRFFDIPYLSHSERLAKIFAIAKEIEYGKLIPKMKSMYDCGDNLAKDYIKEMKQLGILSSRENGKKTLYSFNADELNSLISTI
jgi:archaellum biogenesis ATPase FlaH